MYTLLDCIKHKCRDSYVLYIPTVHAFGLVLLTHTLLVQTHTHDVSAFAVDPPHCIIKYLDNLDFKVSHHLILWGYLTNSLILFYSPNFFWSLNYF